MRRIAAAIVAILLVALSACTSTPAPSTPAAASSSEPSHAAAQSSTASATKGSSSPSVTISPRPSPPGATMASGAALPACTPGAPNDSDTVTFLASGDAWALSPSGSHLTCLFAVGDAGPFEWGPLGDRALLGGFEVKGVAGGPSLSPSVKTFAAIAWSRPTGTAILYAPAAGTSLAKLRLDGRTQDVTPLPSSTYLSVAYHPSGEAFAFAVKQKAGESITKGESIWLSTNTGKTPGRLVFSTEGTTFGAIGFDVDGRHLLYAAQHADNHAELHRIEMTDLTKAPVMWSGPVGRTIVDLRTGLEPGTFAWTTATTGTTSCADNIAMAHSPAGTVRALPDEARPTRAVGWLSATKLLVAAGECAGPLELSAVDVSTGSIVPLVAGVSAAAVRTPVPTPPAPLPASVVSLGSGFS